MEGSKGKPHEAKEDVYTIEVFSDVDQEGVREMGLAVSAEAGQVYDPARDSDWGQISEVYVNPGGVFYVVKSGGRIVGCAGVKNKGGGIAEFKRDRVMKDFRGRGIARDLFEKRIQFARENNFRKIILDTNSPAIHHLCEQFGFKKVGEDGGQTLYELDL